MSTADTLDPEPTEPEDNQITAIAGILVSRMKADPVKSVAAARALYDSGLRADVAATSDWVEINQAFEAVLAEGETLWGNLVMDVGEGSLEGEVPPALKPEVIHAAHAEAKERLTALARRSQTYLIAEPSLHAEMDRRLDEVLSR